jgi:hypothetical protein
LSGVELRYDLPNRVERISCVLVAFSGGGYLSTGVRQIGDVTFHIFEAFRLP